VMQPDEPRLGLPHPGGVYEQPEVLPQVPHT
jgi:hypothetical protein